ncbi:MAG: DMT family transporter [Verrucomicrobia bacterium]|nr:DMT family transporter [Verrucomicrobiota bacterium]
MHTIRRTLRAPLTLILLSGTLYGFLGCLGKELLAEKFTLSSLLFWRFLIAGLWMAGMFWVKKTNREFLSCLFSKSTPVKSFFICSTAYSISTSLYFMATRTAGTGLPMVVFFSYPLFVAAYGFYKNSWQIERSVLFCSLLIPLGLSLLVEKNSMASNAIGIALSILSALSYAIYILKSKEVLKEIPPDRFTLAVCFLSALLFLVFAGFEKELSWPTSYKSLALICAFGVFATAIPIQLLLEGLKEISAFKACMASVLEPIVTLLIGIAFLGEPVGFVQMIGVAIVLAASIFIQVEKRAPQS